MGNLAGGLIQMNSHMILDDFSVGLIVIGIALACIGIIWALVAATSEEISRRVAVVITMVTLVGVAMAIVGAKLPRVQEIKTCADGQVSIEQIAARYDIVKVDGKELTLRVR